MTETKEYLIPKTIEEAIQYSMTRKSFRYLSGGTDVLVNKFQGTDDSTCLIDLTEVHELQTINRAGGYLHIGSSIRLEQLLSDKNIRQKFPELCKAILSVATPVIRKTATIGGNLLCENRCMFFNQSDWWRDAIGYCLKCDGDVCIATGGKKNCFSKFVSDLGTLLISLDATINVVDNDGGYICPLEDIYSGNGLHPRKIGGSAILTSIHLPLINDYKCVYKKLRLRKSLDFTSLTTAVSLNENGKLKMVIGGVDPKPVVVKGSRKDDLKLLVQQCVKKARIVENDVLSRAYRKEMISVYLNDSLEELLKEA